MKECSECKAVKPYSDFYPKTSARGKIYSVSAAGYSYNCKECDKKARKAYVLANPEKCKSGDRAYHIARYGLSVADYNRMFAEQEGKCRGCNRHQTELKRRLCIDHDHKTDTVRGLLCAPCNLILGYARDNKDILSNLINYLSESAVINTDTKVG